MTENPIKNSDGQPDPEGVQGIGQESCLENCRCDFFINCKQRVRLHSVVTSLRNNSSLAEADNDKCKETGSLHDGQDDEAITSKCKTSRKRTATKMSSSAVRNFFDFVLNKRKTKEGKQPELKQSTEIMDHSTETSCDTSVCSAVSQGDTTCTESTMPQTPASMLLNLDSQPSTTQMPFPTAGMPSIVSFPGGNQQALLFLVGSPGMSPPGDLGVSNLGSCAPFGNAVFVAQPVTLNLFPQDGISVGGVIEKAMELANVGTNSLGAVSQQPQQSSSALLASQSEFMAQNSQCSLQSVASKSTLADSSFNNVSQVSQDIVIAPSASGENITIDNVSQSVTVQTSPGSQNQEGNKPSFLQVISTQVSDSSPEFSPPKMIYKRKGASYREVVTQTGGNPEVVIVSEVREHYQEKLSLEQTPNGQKQSTSSAKKPGSEKVRRFACDICEKKFYTNHDLRRHHTIHQDSRPFICEVCSKTFRTHSELKLHSAIHNEGTPYKCEFCGKEFRTKGCVKSHVKYHIGDKRHKCTECGRAFVKSADLKRHMAGHRNEKKYVCDDCGSAFTRRDNLKAHSLLHSRESVVTCDLCSKEFINAVYLKRHMHIHKQAKKKPYECQWCPKTYEQLEGLRRHIRQHVGDEKFVCKHCSKKFITSIQLKRHLWLSHEQDSPYRRSIL